MTGDHEAGVERSPAKVYAGGLWAIVFWLDSLVWPQFEATLL